MRTKEILIVQNKPLYLTLSQLLAVCVSSRTLSGPLSLVFPHLTMAKSLMGTEHGTGWECLLNAQFVCSDVAGLDVLICQAHWKPSVYKILV